MFLKSTYAFLLVLLIVLYVIGPHDVSTLLVASFLLIVLVCLCIFGFRKESIPFLQGQYFNHSLLGLTGMVIVFFQYPLDFLLGNFGSAPDMEYWASERVIIKGLILSAIGILCFLIGYLSYRITQPKCEVRVVSGRPERPVNVSVLVILAFISLTVYFLTVNPLYFAGYYGVVELDTRSRVAISSFQILIFSILIQRCRNLLLCANTRFTLFQFVRKMGWAFNLLIAAYLLSVLVSGDRGPLITFGLLIIGGYLIVTKHKIKIIYIAAFLLIGAVSISYLAKVRNSSLRGYSFIERLEHAQTVTNINRNKSVVPFTAELSKSGSVLYVALDYVPSRHDFFYGRFLFQRIAQIVPFGSAYFPLIFEEDSPEYSGSATFITWIQQGPFAKYGNGSNCMADLYLDFGIVGVILGMILLGYLIRYSEIVLFSNMVPQLFAMVFSIVYFTEVLYISRGVIFGPLRNIFWIFVVLIINKYVMTRIQRYRS